MARSTHLALIARPPSTRMPRMEVRDAASPEEQSVERSRTLPGRFRPQYFVTRTGVIEVNLSQYGPIPRRKRPAHLATACGKALEILYSLRSG